MAQVRKAIDNQKEKAEDEDDTIKKARSETVPFHKLLSEADALDWTLMALGTLGSIVHGLAQPVSYFLLGKALDAFGNNIDDTAAMVRALKKVVPYVWYMAFATFPAGVLGSDFTNIALILFLKLTPVQAMGLDTRTRLVQLRRSPGPGPFKNTDQPLMKEIDPVQAKLTKFEMNITFYESCFEEPNTGLTHAGNKDKWEERRGLAFIVAFLGVVVCPRKDEFESRVVGIEFPEGTEAWLAHLSSLTADKIEWAFGWLPVTEAIPETLAKRAYIQQFTSDSQEQWGWLAKEESYRAKIN
uniref:Uncharacterized protein LOC104236448 n=1 Tax=Nicotiana sylvestris TaxID=4096 RepID=A0A1U7XCS6_NICSY|nr:PREDICTED: uncharacterized protein LOC104236448 [Nicotiana sylvestris]